MWRTRHTFTLMAFLCILINQLVRINLPITLVAMVKHDPESAGNSVGSECLFPLDWNSSSSIVSIHKIMTMEQIQNLDLISGAKWII